ncbi:hypothetical protein Ddc_19294 [Ditylenchus destructor]|nr:hypothetical protein Ddc_19294 [Ditylenchus destructor]
MSINNSSGKFKFGKFFAQRQRSPGPFGSLKVISSGKVPSTSPNLRAIGRAIGWISVAVAGPLFDVLLCIWAFSGRSLYWYVSAFWHLIMPQSPCPQGISPS